MRRGRHAGRIGEDTVFDPNRLSVLGADDCPDHRQPTGSEGQGAELVGLHLV